VITEEKLKELVIKNQTTKINIYREYAQNVFLSFLYQQKKSERFFFKGGTALRLAYQSPRYSEDLDFSLGEIGFSEIEKVILSVIEEMARMNFSPEILESKKTTGGYLGKFLVDIYHEEITVSVQGSIRKGKLLKGDMELVVNDFISDYPVYLLAQPLLIGEKVQAALTRAKPRDFFDVYFLSRKGMIPPQLGSELKRLADTIKDKKIDFTKELGEFLPVSFRPIIKDFTNIFIREMRRYSCS
jgi:predicted nucleotidyltransferase component of viral defense system